jgi:hypothetical protein
VKEYSNSKEKIMKKLLLFLTLISIHLPLYAETWQERAARVTRESNEYQEGLKNNSKNDFKQNQKERKKLGSNKLYSNEFEVSIGGDTYNLNPKNLPKCVDMPFDNCYGSISPPGRKYSGEFKNGNFNGFGKLEFEEIGIIFLGEFNNDKLNGFGKKFIKGKLVYVGEFENGIEQSYSRKDKKEEEHYARIIKESNEYQESLKGNSAEKPNASDGSIEAKSSIQSKKRMFKDSTLPDCNDQKLTYCYARLKINTGTFEGELGNGTFEGKGLIVRNNGGAFMGDFRNNEFISGLDIYSNANDFFKLGDEARKKNLSAGDLLNYVFENFKGRYYAGSFVNNKREGKGIYIDTIEGFSQNGSWKNDEFVSGDTERFGQNNSNQNTPMSRAQSQCDGYGFQKGTNAYAQCVMQMDQLIRQQDYEQQRRANIEFQCRMQKANSFLSYQTPFFVESLNRADQVYNNCMAGLPPPRSGKIDCTISGSNVYCQER